MLGMCHLSLCVGRNGGYLQALREARLKGYAKLGHVPDCHLARVLDLGYIKWRWFWGWMSLSLRFMPIFIILFLLLTTPLVLYGQPVALLINVRQRTYLRVITSLSTYI